MNSNNQCPPPPRVKGLPLLRSALPLLRNPLTFLRDTHAQYGDVYAVEAAHVSFVVLAGTEAIRLLADTESNCLSSSGFWKDTLVEMDCPHSFIAVDGEPHRFQRTLMKPMFAKTAFIPKIPELVRGFQETIGASYHKKTFVAPLFRKGLSDQIGSSLQGYQPTSDEVEALMYYQTAAMNVCSLKKWPRVVLKLPKYRSSKRIVKELADHIIGAERLEGEPPRYLDVLIEKGQKQQPQWFTPGDLRNHAIITFLAGIDTMGATLSFMLLEILRQPEMRRAIEEEIDEGFRKGIPDIATLEKMETLQGFIKEILRLYPTAYAIRRTATRDFTFQGYSIREGQDIILFTTSNHTNPAYFKNPHQFDIERYRPPRSEHVPPNGLVPFGRGPHACIGAGLASVLLPLNLGVLLYYSDVQPACNLKRIGMDFYNPTAALSRSFAIRITPRVGRSG